MASNDQAADTRDEGRIMTFLLKVDGQYPESRLIEEVFGIRIVDETLPTSQDELDRIAKIRETLRKLVREKKIFAAMGEDPETKEQVLQYSVKGFYDTP